MKIQYQIVAPRDAREEILRKQKVLPFFNKVVLDFIDALSGSILRKHEFKRYPELMAMAFWMRKANILKLRTTFENQKGDRTWLGRGIVFHIAPSNVDTIFIYSWFLSMLVGNINVVRISSASDEQLDILIALINEIADRREFTEVRNRFLIVRYEHNDEITSHFSSMCNVRVLWGGDETIRRIRALPIGAAATELVFADKFSFAVINARAFLDLDKKDSLMTGFYNDAYWFGQNTCSSPRLVVWMGEDEPVERARHEFWNLMESKIREKKATMPPAVAMDKLVAASSLALSASGPVRIESTNTSMINRILLRRAEDIKRDLHCGGGLFYELRINSLDELEQIVSPKDQTITVFGIDRKELREFIRRRLPHGINRIVPIGQALEFSTVWDGYDLLREFCREIDVTV